MSTNRLEAGRNNDDKPAATGAPAPPQGSGTVGGAGMRPWLPLIAAVMLMPLLAYGVTTLVLVPKLRQELNVATVSAGENAESTARKGSGESKEGRANAEGQQTVVLSKLLVNVAGTMGSRYLLTSLTLVSDAPDFRARVEKQDAQLRDAAGGILSTKTIADLEKPGARNLIRSELISCFNSVLGGASVREIYITEFAIQ